MVGTDSRDDAGEIVAELSFELVERSERDEDEDAREFVERLEEFVLVLDPSLRRTVHFDG